MTTYPITERGGIAMREALLLLRQIEALDLRIEDLSLRAGVAPMERVGAKKKKDTPLSEQAKSNLKDNTYKDVKTKVEISFSTAFKKENPKALKDYNKELSKLKGSKPRGNKDYREGGQFSTEVKVALEGAFSSTSVRVDIENLSIPQEIGMRSVISVVVNINAEMNEDEDDYDYEDEEEPVGKGKSKRKPTTLPTKTPRTPIAPPPSKPSKPKPPKSDTPKPRRARKIKEKLDEVLPAQIDLPNGEVLPVNTEVLSELPKEQLEQISNTLEDRKDERAEDGKGENTAEEQAIADAVEKTIYSSKLKTREEPSELESALNRTIDKMFEGQSNFLSTEKVRTQKSELKDLTRSIKSMTLEEAEEVAKAYEKQGESLIQSFTGKDSDYEGLSELYKATQEVLKAGIPENPLDNPETEQKLLAEASLEMLSKVSKLDQLETLNEKLKDISISKEEAKTIKEEISNIENAAKALLEAEGIDPSAYKAFVAYRKNPEKGFKEFATALEKSKWMSDNLDELQGKVDKKKSDISKPFREQAGKYLAAKAMEEGFIRDPMYGVRTIGKSDIDDPEVQAQRKQLRVNQARRYQKMPADVRQQAVLETSNLLEGTESLIQELGEKQARGEDVSKELREAKERQAQYQDTLAGLNTASLLQGEGALDGFNEVDENLLNLASQVNDDNLLEAIGVLGSPTGAGKDREQTREAVKGALNNMSIDRFSQVVGDQYEDMTEVLSPTYCPSTPANEAAGVADKNLTKGEKCPEPLDPRLHALMRNYITDSFTDTQSISAERGGFDKQEGKNISNKQRKEFKELWDRSKEEVLKVITMDEDTEGYDEEKVASTLELFGLELRMKNYETLMVDGKKIVGHEAIMKYIRKVQEMDKKEREKKVRSWRSSLKIS